MFLVSSCSCLRSIHWSQVLSWEWRCSWSSANRRCSNYIWVINNFIAYQGATYIRGFTAISLYNIKYDWLTHVTWWTSRCRCFYNTDVTEQHGLSNHQHLNCLFNNLYGLAAKKLKSFCVTGHFIMGIKWIHPQRNSNVERFSMS